MKAIRIVFLGLLILALNACVPSLHGIVKEGEELIDDRIIRQWVGNKLFDRMQVNIKVNDEQGEEKEFSSMQEMIGYFNGDSVSSWGTTWLLERAGKVTYEKNEGSNTASVSLDIGTASMAPQGYEVTQFDSLPYYILTHVDWDDTDTITSYLTVKLTEIGEKRYMDFVPFPKGIDFWEGRFATNLIAGHTFASYEVNNGELVIHPIDGEHIEDLIEKKRVRLKHENVEGSTILTASTDELRAFLEKYQDDKDLFDDEELLRSID